MESSARPSSSSEWSGAVVSDVLPSEPPRAMSKAASSVALVVGLNASFSSCLRRRGLGLVIPAPAVPGLGRSTTLLGDSCLTDARSCWSFCSCWSCWSCWSWRSVGCAALRGSACEPSSLAAWRCASVATADGGGRSGWEKMVCVFHWSLFDAMPPSPGLGHAFCERQRAVAGLLESGWVAQPGVGSDVLVDQVARSGFSHLAASLEKSGGSLRGEACDEVERLKVSPLMAALAAASGAQSAGGHQPASLETAGTSSCFTATGGTDDALAELFSALLALGTTMVKPDI
mmetsp:Transcript_61234/g.182416  ORF Transcript_61234/g.182416 Transcript_61234/m.182416 type:complete len:288 (-) Transcript_61234:26-889(-)